MAKVAGVAAALLVTHCASIRSVEVAFEARLASFASSASASSAAAALAAHLRSLGEDEPHHVCVTGNAANVAVDTFVLQGSGASRTDFSMPSKISSNACTVQEAQVGSTLFTIAESLPDSCLPRWRAQSSSCDVLFHAHSGSDCTDLSKFRLVNDKCDADLLVVSDNKELSQCFDSKMAAHEAEHPGSACEHRGLWFNANEGNVGHDLVAAMKTAMSKHSGEIKAKFFKVKGLSENTKAPLRDQLLGMTNAQQHINVQDDLLKASQGLPGAQAGSLAQHVSSMRNEGKAKSTDNIVIIDSGSGNIKAGLPAAAPSVVFPAVTATAKYDKAMVGIDHKDVLVGDEAQLKRGVHKLTHPIVHGIVQDWSGMEKIWEHTFMQELNIDPSTFAVMLTEPPANPKINREKMAAIMFDTFQVPKLYVAMQAVLALYSTGKTTGLSIDSGDGVTHIVPVYDGYALPHAIKRIDLGGADLTTYMMKLLMESASFRPATSAEREITRDIKEKLGYVAQDFNAEFDKVEQKEYTLPDGAQIQVGSERFRCAEPMFQPKMLGIEHGGIHTAAFQVIQNSDIDIRSDLYENIVISGGNTMFAGFADRLQAEIKSIAPEHSTVNVRAMEERKDAVWTGAAILTSLANFADMWVTKTDYDEDTNVIHTKCAY